MLITVSTRPFTNIADRGAEAGQLRNVISRAANAVRSSQAAVSNTC
jgi:hypothetical protein